MNGWRIDITLKPNRSLPGVLRLLRPDGTLAVQCSCLGLADGDAAKKAGNKNRDPELPFGDTPLGNYLGALLSQPMQPDHSYGTEPPIALDPTGGQALKAKTAGRSGLLIHSGPLAKGEFLRPTHGCIRVRPDAHAQIVRTLKSAGVKSLPVEITEKAA